MESAEGVHQSDIIQQTRNIILHMTQQQKFTKAKRHLLDAIHNRDPRNDYEAHTHTLYRLAYNLQTSTSWSLVLFFLSFVFMYLIVAEPTNRMHKGEPLNITIVVMEGVILALFWIDIGMEIYHKQFWKVEWKLKFSLLFQMKLAIISLLTVDSLVYYPLYKSYPVRLFRITRPFLPYLYNQFARRSFQSFLSVYKDIIAYTVFYFTIILCFGILGTQLMSPLPGVSFDWFKENYDDVWQTSFLFYILASFDSWPDYQIVVIDNSKWYYIFLVAFIFLNYFYFVTIPTTVMFNSFKKTRSALMIIDQIHQQNSLLLCFICLGEDNLCIKSETFHQFMWYTYRNKLRLIDDMKELSFRLEENNTSEIFISNFMKLCKIIESEPGMHPPAFDDWGSYIRFRRFLKHKLHLKKIVVSSTFSLCVIILILTNLILVILSLFVSPLRNLWIEIIFVVFFEVEVLMRMVGIGIERFCSRTGNVLELGLAGFYIVMLGLLGRVSHQTVVKLLSLLRLFRIPRIFNIMLANDYFKRFYFRNTLFRKVRVVFQDLYVSVVIGVRMFPLFITLYYILGIVGIEGYDQTFLAEQKSPYSVYDPVSNFRTFLLSQVVLVQSMIEAGWSMIIFDHVYRFGYIGLVYTYFIFVHILIDTTIFSMMKGMVAELYETTALECERLDKEEQLELEKEKLQQRKKDEIAEIRRIMEEGEALGYDSLKKKQIYENKLDRQMMESLKAALHKKHKRNFKRSKTLRSLILAKPAGEIFKERDQFKTQPRIQGGPSSPRWRPNKDPQQKRESVLVVEEIKNDCKESKGCNLDTEEKQGMRISSDMRIIYEDELKSFDSDSISIGDSDIQEIQDNLLDRIILREEEIPYAEAPVYPRFLLQFLGRKLKIARQKIQKEGAFNPNIMGIRSKSSLSFYTNVLEALINIKKPEHEQKEQIMEAILKLKIQDKEEVKERLNKKSADQKQVLIKPMLHKIMLSNISQDFIKKFQIEYFSSVYGNSFREINRSTLDPLLRHEALMLYNLNKVLRYPPSDTSQFWNIIATIQDNVSRTLLHHGSIFTFVFEVEELANNWFAIEVRENMEIKVHFLKTGIWIYHRGMKFEEIYYGHDIFHCEDEELAASDNAEKTIKLLYNAFETLGFSMLNETNFFDSDPAKHAYDLYSFVLNCSEREADKESLVFGTEITEPSEKEKKKVNLRITKIMGVILSKEKERPPGKELKYGLTNLNKILELQLGKKKERAFRFDEDENKTYQKLQNLAEGEYERLIDSESLEYAFLIDSIECIRNTCLSNVENFVSQAELVINKEFQKVQMKK